MQTPTWLDRVRAIIVEFDCGIGGKLVRCGINIMNKSATEDHVFFQWGDTGIYRFPDAKLIGDLVEWIDNGCIADQSPSKRHNVTLYYSKPVKYELKDGVEVLNGWHVANTIMEATRGLGGWSYEHALTREFILRNKELFTCISPFPADVTLSYLTKVTKVMFVKFCPMSDAPSGYSIRTNKRMVVWDKEFGEKDHPPVCFFVNLFPSGVMVYEATTFDEDGNPLSGACRTVPLICAAFYDNYDDLNAASAAVNEHENRKEYLKS